MKNFFVFLILLFSLQIHAQIPDSLGVELPWDVIRFSSCDDTMGEGPKSDVSGVWIALKSDISEKDASGNCLVRTKTWDIFDWKGSKQYAFSQQGIINFPEPLMCEENIFLSYDQLPYTLNKDNLLLNEDVGHEYSFSHNNIADDERIIKQFSPLSQVFYMYDHTASRVCKVNVYKTTCEDDIIFSVPETVEIEFDGEPYIELTLDMLGAEVDYPCDPFTTKIRVGNQPNGVLYSQSVGRIVTVKVELEINTGVKYETYVEVNVTGIKPDPIDMFIEDKTFVAGETIEIEVWAEDIFGLNAWQHQLEFKNAKILDLLASESFAELPINIFNDGNALKVLWFTSNGLPIDIESDMTWFTLVIEPEIDGSTIDIFTTQQDPWSSIFVQDDDYEYEVDAEFIFNIAPRVISDVDQEITYSDIKVFPNPSLNMISVSGLPNSNSPVKFDIYSLEGKLMLSNTTSNNKSESTIDISDLPTGLYVLQAKSGNTLATHKISKI